MDKLKDSTQSFLFISFLMLNYDDDVYNDANMTSKLT